MIALMVMIIITVILILSDNAKTNKAYRENQPAAQEMVKRWEEDEKKLKEVREKIKKIK